MPMGREFTCRLPIGIDMATTEIAAGSVTGRAVGVVGTQRGTESTTGGGNLHTCFTMPSRPGRKRREKNKSPDSLPYTCFQKSTMVSQVIFPLRGGSKWRRGGLGWQKLVCKSINCDYYQLLFHRWGGTLLIYMDEAIQGCQHRSTVVPALQDCVLCHTFSMEHSQDQEVHQNEEEGQREARTEGIRIQQRRVVEDYVSR